MKRFLLAWAVLSSIAIPVIATENNRAQSQRDEALRIEKAVSHFVLERPCIDDENDLKVFESRHDIDALRILITNKKDATFALLCHFIGSDTIDNMELVSMLIEKGANPNQPVLARHGRTLLSKVIQANRSQIHIIASLIALGVDPNLPDKKGETTLHICMQYIESKEDKDISETRCFQEILTLLQHGANPLLKNNNGETPRESIAEHRRKAYPTECEKVAALLKQNEERWRERIRMNLHGTPRPACRRVKIERRPSSQATNLLENPLPKWNGKEHE
jgi:ankyrin repeat protein